MTIPGGLFDTPMMGSGATTPIDQMIQHLVPQPPPQQAPNPQQGQSILGKIHDMLVGTQDNRMAVPAGYEGLVRPDQMPNAPGLMQRLAQMDPTVPGFRQQALNAAQQAVGGGQLMTQIAERQRILQGRQQMAKLFPLQPGASLDDIRNNIAQQYNYAVQNGDVELIKDLGDRMSTLFNIQKQPITKLGPGDLGIDAQGNVLATNTNPVPGNSRDVVNPKTGETRSVPKDQNPPPGFMPVPTTGVVLNQQGANERKTEKYQWGVNPVTGKTEYLPESAISAGGFTKPPTGAGANGGLATPMAAKVGQFGEMLKKSSDLLPAMDALNVKLSQSAAQDIAANGATVPFLHTHIPGTQGVGSMLVNKSPEYATYQAALTPFITAAAHAMGGARITQEQINQIQQAVEIKPGESAQSRAQKTKNLVDLMNSIGGALPQDAIASQEDQMDPKAMTQLQGYGYQGAARKTAPSTGVPATGGKRAITRDQALFLQTKKGMSPAQIAKDYVIQP